MRITLIYLAAGNSRRFGSNKLLYEIDKKTMYSHLLERLYAVVMRHPDWKVLVVTQYPCILEQVQEMGMGAVFSQESEKGMSYTIETAVRAAEGEAYAFFVADQPYLTEKTVEGFLTEMEQSRAKLGSIRCHGVPGNPTFFSASYREELLALTGDCGGRKILKKYPKDVLYYEVLEKRELLDIDLRNRGSV